MPFILERFVYSFLEGCFFFFAIRILVTGFFGCRPRRMVKRRKVLFSVLLLAGYALADTTVNTISRYRGSDSGALNGVLILFLLAYWTTHTTSRKRYAFLVCTVSVEMTTLFLTILFSLEDLVINGKGEEIPEGMNWFSMLPLCGTLLVTGLLSVIASRHRKMPMQTSFVVSVLLLMLLFDNLTSHIGIQAFSRFQTFITFRFSYNGEGTDKLQYVVILTVVILLLFLSLLFLEKDSEAVYYRDQNALSGRYLEAQKAHYESLTEADRDIRRIRHDMKNHLYCMEELYRKKEYDELGRYLGQLAESVEQTDRTVHVGNEIADAILSEKRRQAKEKEITLLVSGNLGEVKMSALDICTIFANLLDNAIEAVEGLDTAERRIEMEIKRNDHFLYLDEKNPVAQKVEIRENSVLTTKKDRMRHGFGLLNIRQAVEKYDGECALSCTKEEGADFWWFRMEIMLPL